MQIEDSLKQAFAPSAFGGQNKVIGLKEAIARYVKPGSKIFLGWNANAAVAEILRQYRGKKPDFTVVMTMTWDLSLNLVHCGLVKKLISTNCSYGAPAPGPSHSIQRAFSEGTIQIENWSLYSLQQGLMAAALGVGFMPTRSIAGSSMATDNKDSFVEMTDPFDCKKKIGAIKAISADISIIHALAADAEGNAILSPVSQDTLWGARASSGGVLVTAEKIVTSDFIRQNACLVGIPGYLVNSVSLCPLGAHPQGHFSPLRDIESYAEDYDFMLGQKNASVDVPSLDDWLTQWVFDVKGHDDYVSRLGSKCISMLKQKPGKSWESGLPPVKTSSDCGGANRTEGMVIAASRVIAERVKDAGYHVLLAGIGIPGLAAWLAYYQLKNEGINIDLALGSGVLGYQPRPGDPNLLTVCNASTAKMLTNTSDMYGFIVSGAGARCLSVIGAAQIDQCGNINTTRVGENKYISGSGGNNDNACGAAEVMVVATQSKRRCVDAVDYVTSQGDRVSTLVTSMGIFTKDQAGKFVLSQCIIESDSSSVEDRIAQIGENCGWPLKAAKKVAVTAAPTENELALLRAFDPQGYLLKD
jgi:acyl CoA:acetate/3-ketoacid CoA transferase alpha subunit/acyl CoA:acetate/3-ketoacid CoA transferase beta subunit